MKTAKSTNGYIATLEKRLSRAEAQLNPKLSASAPTGPVDLYAITPRQNREANLECLRLVLLVCGAMVMAMVSMPVWSIYPLTPDLFFYCGVLPFCVGAVVLCVLWRINAQPIPNDD
jgi:protein-S-isoprenylcysteine O-methyltransferase Ste14